MKKNHGFTLVEIIVTVALIGILMALTIPGVMNYFSDVNMDKARAEANSVLSIAQSYQDKLSLSGNDNSSGTITISDETIKQSIVDKAKGTGKLDILVFEDGNVKRFSYIVSGYDVQLSVSGNLIVMNSGDEFYQKEELPA
ncbi:MAG: type II secretion system protein [Coprobacillus sp.]